MSDDKKYAQISNESIQAWAEAVGITDLSTDVLRTLGADATYRLHQILNICNKYLSHSCRKKLTSDDFNRALSLMDASPVYGHNGSEEVEWVGVPELGVYVPHDPPVNLASTALSGDIYHQPGNTYVKGKWVHVSGHIMTESENNAEDKSLSSLPLSPHLIQYYRKLFYITTNPSVKLFATMCEDLESSPNIGLLTGPIIRSVLKGAQKANQKPLILRRLLLIIKSLLLNPHNHIGPHNYIQDIVNVLIFSVVTERKNPQDTNSIRTLASNILLKLSRKEGDSGTTWELAVSSLSEVIGSSTRPWTQHAGALTGLIPLGIHALYRALMPVIRKYYIRLSQALSNNNASTKSSGILAKDIIDANMTFGLLLVSFVNMMVSLLKSLPDKQNLYVGKFENNILPKLTEREEAVKKELSMKLNDVYTLGEEIFGSMFALQIPLPYVYLGGRTSHFDVSSHPSREGFFDETFLSEDVPPAKSKKLGSLKVKPLSTSKEKHYISVSQAFDDYKPILPIEKRKIYMCVRGCSTKNFNYLKRKKSVLPEVTPHLYRNYLVQFSKYSKKVKMISRMPHWTFIKPLFPPPRPCYCLNSLFL
ncbi:TAF6-like RNA polymerase II factor subunit 6L [Armadillidium nasatum]|uniref:TAF6-like RNA polymerase II factor subunit 6L n=1 Tax=Armadillidium nasatum TaxID=96803 RepID=A0A5N5SPU1_9CRUS|nr:TAF6-like RNA polymerase II factor subunit 6L [Armadillidium nasatum]